MKLAIGSDHAGYEYKCEVIKYLEEKGHEMIDVGTHSLDSCDYPTYGKEVGVLVSSKKVEFGILICSSGEGIMIAANKINGIRAGLAYNDDTARLMRQHNDANIISFGANFMDLEDVKRRIDIFLSTDFEGGRHQRRVNLI